MLYDTRWDEKETKAAPRFGRRWHSFSRLDIRPVLWSLRNRPEEWEQNEYTLLHKTSKHEFWIGNGFWHYSLYRADCSCTKAAGGKFSIIQKIQFSFARRTVTAIDRAKRSAALVQINEQFSEHFLPARTASQGQG